MYGRRGMDQFGLALVATYVLMAFIATITRVFVIQYVGFALCVYELYRMFSRNIAARERENNWFLRWARPIYTKIGRFISRVIREFRDKEHHYFNCPKCKTRLRVPKNRGTLRVTCPKCGEVMNVKS